MELRLYRADHTLTHLALQGRLDHAGVENIEGGFMALTSGRALPTVVELEDVTFMVSIGMRMLIEAAKSLSHHDCPFILVGPRGLVQEALVIAKLNEVFTIVDTPEAALDKIAKL